MTVRTKHRLTNVTYEKGGQYRLQSQERPLKLAISTWCLLRNTGGVPRLAMTAATPASSCLPMLMPG